MTATAAKPAVVTVSTAAELKAAIAKAGNDTTIVMKDGDYGSIAIKNYQGSGLTLVSADAKHPASVTLSITGSQNVTVRNLEIETSGAKWSNGLGITKSSNITVDHNTFRGVDPTMTDASRGLYVDKSSHITVTGNSFTDGLTRGAVFTNTTDLDVLNNAISGVRSEGFNFAGVKDVEIAGNTGTNFKPVGADHPDFIQFWTKGIATASENIHIHGNTFTQGTGGGAQGIFLGNEDGIAYRNVVIENNSITSCYPNGILVLNAVGVTVANNTAVGSATSTSNLSIRLQDVLNAAVEGNTANAISLINTTALVNKLNVIADLISRGGAADAIHIINDTITAQVNGTSGNDTLVGKKMNTLLVGGAGDDTIRGGGYNDVIKAGSGNNMLTGGAGADKFVFDKLDTAPGQKTVDKIFDFSFQQGDKLVFDHYTKDFFGATIASDELTVSSYDGMIGLVRESGGHVTAQQKGSTDVLVLTVKDNAGGVTEVHLSNMWQAYHNVEQSY